MKEENINRVLDIGIKIICRKGYHDLGLRELLENAGIPSGSFYYYFKSKEDFALMAAKYYADNVEQYFKDELLNSKNELSERLASIFDEEIERLKSTDFREGCILGDLSSEVAGEMENIRKMVESKYSAWQEVIRLFLKEGQEAGLFRKEFDPEQMAMFFLSNRQGALTRVKSTKSIEPYKIFKSFMMNMIIE